ncbi:ABC transporter substrate-binding protein [Paenibacillus sp. UNC496MF]|uniref:ABC transporter substrate-binding protein n=1 Tax=Paenibacillus sp. UNC496MF TaxID=1502753 RepID=UPI000B324A0A|nr:ABC transporter substrate-binding protein [Paenibacillus sp. UNC496MF]
MAPQLKDVPTIAYDLPVESVLSFSPDLIIIGSESAVQKGLYEQHAKIAPTYVLGDKVNKDWRAALTTIGDLLGKQDEAAKALQDYDAKAAEAKRSCPRLSAARRRRCCGSCPRTSTSSTRRDRAARCFTRISG